MTDEQALREALWRLAHQHPLGALDMDLDAFEEAIEELSALRPLRAAVLRYGQALAAVRALGVPTLASIVPPESEVRRPLVRELDAALGEVRALALSLAVREGQGSGGRAAMTNACVRCGTPLLVRYPAPTVPTYPVYSDVPEVATWYCPHCVGGVTIVGAEKRAEEIGRRNHLWHHSADICTYEACDRGVCPEMRALALALAAEG